MRQEIIESAKSYAVGGGTLTFASLVDIASVAQQLAIILGCAVVAIRLIHDSLKLWRAWRKK